MFILSPKIRRIVYAVIFEFFAIIFSTILLAMMSDNAAEHSLPIAIATSAIALVWNYIYNSIFEYVEHKLKILSRSVKVRLLHATSFEIGLCVFTVPLYMWWYDVGMIKAIGMEIFILIFFFVYTYLFTLLFDRLVPRQSCRKKY